VIRVGCCGWPVSQSRYQEILSCVEIASSFEQPPQLATAKRWRETAPEEFAFSIRAPRLITHTAASPTYERRPARLGSRALLRCGHFKPTDEVAQAWEQMASVVRVLQAKFVVFQTPASFYANADHLRDLYRFFKTVRREGARFVWEPRGESWRPEMIRRVCRDLELIHAVDPMVAEPQAGAALYFRLHGRHAGGKIDFAHGYTDAELRHLIERCGGRSAYVFFNNAPMWQDARRFEALVHPEAARLRTSHVRHLRSL